MGTHQLIAHNSSVGLIE